MGNFPISVYLTLSGCNNIIVSLGEKGIIEIPIKSIKLSFFDQFITQDITVYDFLNFSINIKAQLESKITTETFHNCDCSWEKYLERNKIDHHFVKPPEYENAYNLLEKNNCLWCYNKSCSGKTYLGIFTVDKFDNSRFVYNPVYNYSCTFEFVVLLICFGRDVTLLIDDLHCQPEKAYQIIELIIEHHEKFSARNLRVFIISWSDLYLQHTKMVKGIIKTVRIEPSRFVYLLQNRIPENKRNVVLTLANDNIALLDAARKIIDQGINIRKSNLHEKLFNYFVPTFESIDLKTLYVTAVLGTYDFETPIGFLKKWADTNTVISFSELPTAKNDINNFFLGHRLISEFICDYIENKYPNHTSEVEKIILEFLDYIDPKKLWLTLSQILGNEKESASGQFVPMWKLLTKIEEEIIRQNQIDPTWDRTPSSMYFVIKSLRLLGQTNENTQTLNKLVSKIQSHDKRIIVDLSYFQTSYDFKKIKEKMIFEDETNDNLPPDLERGHDIDDAIMHLNWFLGLVAGLKIELRDNGYEKLHEDVISHIFENQLDSGAWYPQRVPWVTARILIGLSESGYSIENKTIKKAVDYLLHQLHHNGYWDARTGGWNASLETTALCIEALTACRFIISENQKTKKALDFLNKSRQKWMKKDNELDGATTACTIIKTIGPDFELLEYIQKLSFRNIHELITKTSEVDYETEQSCKPAQIGYYIIDLGWFLLKSDLPGLLKNFIRRSQKTMKKIFISYTYDSANHGKRVKKIADYLLGKGYDLEFDEYAPFGENIVTFMEKIAEVDIVLLIGTRGYVKKTKLQKGGGYYEKDLLSLEKMKGRSNKIIPISLAESFEAGVPLPFQNNKGLHFKRVDSSCLKKIEQAILSI